MKKLITIILLVVLAASLASRTLTPAAKINLKVVTHDDTTYQGNFLYRDDQVFWIQTKAGKTLVLENEIKVVYDRHGKDITADFLAQEGEQPSKISLSNIHAIGLPLWLIAVMTTLTAIRTLQ